MIQPATLCATTAMMFSISLSVQAANHEHKGDHHREHGAHVHGVAELTLAQQGKEVELELRTPSVNIVGFEYEASTSEQRHTVMEAREELMAGAKNFHFSGTDCVLEHARVDVSALIDADEHDHQEDEHHDDDHDKDRHAHEDDHHMAEQDKDHHDEHEHEHEHEHSEKAHDGHHDHDEHDGEGRHSDITAHYHFECKTSSKLESVSVELLEHFHGIEKLKVMWITDEAQGAATLNHESRNIRLR